MSLVDALATALGLGAAMAATAHWASRGGAQAVEVVVAGFSGPLLALPALWLASMLLGVGPLAALIAGLTTAAIVAYVTPTREEPPDRAPTPLRDPAIIALIVVAMAAAAFAPYGMERPDGIHRMAMADWQTHLLLGDQMMASDRFPPLNPFLPSAGPAPYDHGFHLLAATASRAVGHTDPFPALLALTLLTLAAVPFVAYTVARGLYADPRLAAVAAFAATLLAGFDVVVIVAEATAAAWNGWSGNLDFEGLRQLVPSTHLDSWLHHDERQFNGVLLTGVWAPQQLLAALAGLLGIHWLSGRDGDADAWVPGLALGAVPMLSAYVAMTLAAGLTVAFFAATPVRERRRWLVTAAVAAVAALPFARLAVGGSSGLVIAPSAAGGWFNGAVFTELMGDGFVTRLLDTPMVYLIDFGLVGVLAAIAARRDLRRSVADDHRRRLVLIALAGLVLVALVRPPVGGPNNLYARGLLIPWVLAACLAAGEWPRCYGRIWGFALALSLAGTAYAAVGVVVEGAYFWATPYGSVAMARAVNEATEPSDAVAMPRERLPGHAYWLRRPLVIYDTRHAVLFGADRDQAERTRSRLDEALALPDPVAAHRELRALGADLVLVPNRAVPAGWRRSDCFEDLVQAGGWIALRLRDCGA